MPQLHLRAEPGDYAPIVLLPGDPNRATAIAALLRRRPRGDAAGQRPPAPLRLHGYLPGRPDQRPDDRHGRAGGGDRRRGAPAPRRPAADPGRHLRRDRDGHPDRRDRDRHGCVAVRRDHGDLPPRRALCARGRLPAHPRPRRRRRDRAGAAYQVGPICTVDVFYNPDADYFSRWAARGVLAFEMESSALFFLAARARATGADVRAATILTVSDVLGEGVTSEQSYLPLDELERRTATTLQVALAAATSPAVTAASEDGIGRSGGGASPAEPRPAPFPVFVNLRRDRRSVRLVARSRRCASRRRAMRASQPGTTSSAAASGATRSWRPGRRWPRSAGRTTGSA